MVGAANVAATLANPTLGSNNTCVARLQPSGDVDDVAQDVEPPEPEDTDAASEIGDGDEVYDALLEELLPTSNAEAEHDAAAEIETEVIDPESARAMHDNADNDVKQTISASSTLPLGDFEANIDKCFKDPTSYTAIQPLFSSALVCVLCVAPGGK